MVEVVGIALGVIWILCGLIGLGNYAAQRGGLDGNHLYLIILGPIMLFAAKPKTKP